MKTIMTDGYLRKIAYPHHGTMPGFKERMDYKSVPSFIFNAGSDFNSGKSIRRIWRRKKRQSPIVDEKDMIPEMPL